jgi:hypothetical protein
MGNKAARLCLVPALAMALAACGRDKTPEVEPNIPPTGYKQEILTTLTRTLDDPTNVRDAYLSDPVLTSAGTSQRYTACVRFNARDLGHNYIGSKDRIAYFYGGHLNQLVEATKEQCGNAAYKPFPELEKLCLANKCN